MKRLLTQLSPAVAHHSFSTDGRPNRPAEELEPLYNGGSIKRPAGKGDTQLRKLYELEQAKGR